MLAAVLHAGDINLLPFDGYIVGLEDSLDRFRDFGTDSVTWDDISVLCSWVPPSSYLLQPFFFLLLHLHHGDRVPGIRVTVYFPPNLVGLKISD